MNCFLEDEVPKEMEKEKISVIMSVYNEKERELKAAINSILGQTYQNLEFIIILDNPLNKELQIVIEDYAERDSRIRFFINTQNMGLVRSLNKALKYVTGSFIARMDADDISLKSRLEDQLNYLIKNNADFVFAGIEYIDEDDKKLFAEKAKGNTPDSCKRTLKYVNCSFHPTWLFKKDILEKLHQYNSVEYAEDYDFICRAVHEGYCVCGQNKVLLQYRIRNTGISMQNKTKQDVMAACIRKEAGKNHYSTEKVLQEYERRIRDEKYMHFIEERYEDGVKYKALLHEKKYLRGCISVLLSFMKHPSLLSEIYRKAQISIINH